MMRFTLLGAVGFGIGVAIGTYLEWVGTLLGGAVGGAALGLALMDFRRAVFLALLGALGLTLGVLVGIGLGAAFFNFAEVPIAAIAGAVLGASLGLAFGDWRRVLILGVVGSVGCGIGLSAGGSLQALAVEMGDIVFAGIIGGASLGAALGYLETAGGGHRIGRIVLPLAVVALPVVAVYVLVPIATEAQRAEEAFPTEDGEIIFESEGPPYPGTVISTINSDGTALATVPVRPGHDNYSPAWSPDGEKIAFAGSRGKPDTSWGPQLYIVDADGSGLRRLTDTPSTTAEFDPAWSPDGKRIAFTKWSRPDVDVYTMNATDGSQQENLTRDIRTKAASPDWSPDGEEIAFTKWSRPGDDVYTMKANGTGHTNLTNNSAYDVTPAWSPDGKKIAFSSSRAGDNDEVFVMEADGTKVERLTKTQAFEYSPDWRQLP